MLERLGEILRKATNKIANAIFLDKNLVDSVVKDLQRALIEADVNILLVKQLSDKIKKEALDERIKGIEKKEHIIKLLHDELIKILGEYNPLKLADSNDVQIGEKVIAIGNPLGLQFSVSEGIVSAVKRPGLTNINVYIQTDAALNPGNSGGPLINKQGEVIGINNFKVGGGESLGFALESNKIKEVVNDISEKALQKDLV